MKIGLITESLSPHQLPLANQLINLVGSKNFRYLCRTTLTKGRASLGWQQTDVPEWVIITNSSRKAKKEAAFWEDNAEVIISGIRNYNLFEKRSAKCKLSFYMSERWFKQSWGFAKLLIPHYFYMSSRFVNLLKSPYFYYLPIGNYAANDMLKLIGFMLNKFNLFMHFPELSPVLNVPCSKFIISSKGNNGHPDYSKFLANVESTFLPHMRLWGYFVDKSLQTGDENKKIGNCINILWVGRLLPWKDIDILIKSVKKLILEGADIKLTIIGRGPQVKRLKNLSKIPAENRLRLKQFRGALDNRINFLPPVPIREVREFMKNSDIYVLPSNSYEGWGAVVNEAMEEGCAVIASSQSGAGATMITHGENGLLFESGDVEDLIMCISKCYNNRQFLEKLKSEAKNTMANVWGVENGAMSIMNLIGEIQSGLVK
jgi:glycosyltransferase involved in cell wall biosynthesis